MTLPTVTTGQGHTFHLGRINPTAIFDAGDFKVIVSPGGKTHVVPRLGPHFHPPQARMVRGDVTTRWLEKCKDAIAQPDGNTRWGDCVIASKLHAIGSWSGNATGHAILSSDDEAYAEYQKICGRGDNGCVIADVLDWMQRTGLICGGNLHKIDGYAAVDTANRPLVESCVEVFGSGIALGINLPGQWASSVQGNDFTWDDTNDRVVGGHDVPIIDVTPKGAVIATWGFWGTITWRALANKRIVEEAYQPLGQDWYANNNLSPSGFDVEGLKAALKTVQGGGIPTPNPSPPTPTPTPTPPPTPTPTPPPTPSPWQGCLMAFVTALLRGENLVDAGMALIECLLTQGVMSGREAGAMRQALDRMRTELGQEASHGGQAGASQGLGRGHRPNP